MVIAIMIFLEVYDYVHQIFPLSKKRDDNFIAGHSMEDMAQLNLH